MKKIVILLILINFSSLVFGARKLEVPTQIEEEAVDNELRAKAAVLKEILQGKVEKKEEKKPEDELKPEEKIEKKGEMFPEVKKINDDLYVGKVQSGSGIFYLAMERINSLNIRDWLKYSAEQLKRSSSGYLRSNDGAYFFDEVIKDYKSNTISPQNELWIAYGSRKPITEKAKLFDENREINRDIEMFVTVITSPEALITSHMGISRTVEAAEDLAQEPPRRAKHPDQSIHLHSFAAKVMKKLDPRKKYMLTAPVEAMRNILINKMPLNTLFVGDSLYQKRLEDAQKDPRSLLTSDNLKIRKGETEKEREERLKRIAQTSYNSEKEKILLLKSHPPRIIRTIDGEKEKFIIQKIDGSPLVDFDESTKQYQWIFTPRYQASPRMPYVLIDLDALAAARDLVPEK